MQQLGAAGFVSETTPLRLNFAKKRKGVLNATPPEGSDMTNSQSEAVWELCRQGFPLTADEAETRWENGEIYLPNWHTKVSRTLERLIERCNWEAREHSGVL